MYQPGESSSGFESKGTGSTATCPPESQPSQSQGNYIQGKEPVGPLGKPASPPSQKADEFIERTRDTVRTMAERAREEAGAVWTRMKDQSEKALAQGKDRTAEGIGHFAAAVQQTADRLRQDGDHNLAGYAEDVSNQMDRAAHYLRENSLRSVADDLGRAVRRRPGLFLAGLFIGGLVAARFIKASREARMREEAGTRGGEWGGSSGLDAAGQKGNSPESDFQSEGNVAGVSGLPDDVRSMSQPGVSPGPASGIPGTGLAPESGEAAGQAGYRPQAEF